MARRLFVVPTQWYHYHTVRVCAEDINKIFNVPLSMIVHLKIGLLISLRQIGQKYVDKWTSDNLSSIVHTYIPYPLIVLSSIKLKYWVSVSELKIKVLPVLHVALASYVAYYDAICLSYGSLEVLDYN